jgi:hypothetical protein
MDSLDLPFGGSAVLGSGPAIFGYVFGRALPVPTEVDIALAEIRASRHVHSGLTCVRRKFPGRDTSVQLRLRHRSRVQDAVRRIRAARQQMHRRAA